MVLLAATIVALLWANSPWWDSYESVWTTKLAITIGDSRDHGRPAPLGQPGPDDVLLPRRRAGGQARARPRRAARAPPPGDPRGGGDRRDARAGLHLPRDQRGRPRRARLGHRDVDRHRLRARRAGPADPARGDAHARVPALAGGRRRPVRAARDRDLLHGARLARGARRRGGVLRRAARVALRAALAAARLHRGGDRPLGGAVPSRASTRSSRGSRSGWRRARTRRRATTSSGRPRWRARSASSRRPSSRARLSRACSRRSRRTSGCSTACIRGRATSSCRCSRWRTPAST